MDVNIILPLLFWINGLITDDVNICRALVELDWCGSIRAWQLTITFEPLRGSVCYVRIKRGVLCFVPWLSAGAVPRSSVRGCVPPGSRAIVPRLSEGRDWPPLVTWACVSVDRGWGLRLSGVRLASTGKWKLVSVRGRRLGIASGVRLVSAGKLELVSVSVWMLAIASVK